VVDVALKHNEKVKHTYKSAGSGKYLIDSRDGKKYKIVKIGTQTWMAENLNYSGENDDIGSCYDQNPKNCVEYGALYTWEEAMKVCPSGWHLPSVEEWQKLVDFAGGDKIALKKLRAKNKWNEPNCKYTTKETTGRGKVIVTEYDYCTTDEFGFAALPINSSVYGLYGYGKWWSSSVSNSSSDYSYSWIMGYRRWDISNIDWDRYKNDTDYDGKSSSFNVRCIQGYGETSWRKKDEEYAYSGETSWRNEEAEIEHKKNTAKLMKHIKEQDSVRKERQSYAAAISSNPRFNKVKFGIGGAFGVAAFTTVDITIDNITIDNINKTDSISYNGLDGSLGIALSIPIMSSITFNPELYFAYRKIANDKKCSQYDCNLEIEESALSIPLIFTLAWPWLDYYKDDMLFDVYMEAGASLGIPLSTSVNSNSEVRIDRRKYDVGFVFGFGSQIGDFSLGVRATLDGTYVYGGVIARYLI